MNRRPNFITSSFKRQIFFIFLLVTLALVIAGGVFTLQGFQARIRSDYEKQDELTDLDLNNKLQEAIDLSEAAIDAVEENEILAGSFSAIRRNNREIYTELYKETSQVRSFAIVELYANGKCIFTTNQGVTSEDLPENYSILKAASEEKGKTVYALDPNNATDAGATLLMARQINSGFVTGVVIVRIEQENISDLLAGQINSKDGFILANQYLRPICQLGAAENGSYLKLVRANLIARRLYTEGIPANVYMKELGDTGLISIYITPYPLEETAISAGYQIIVIFALISVVICFFVATGLSEYFARPIVKLTAAMKQFRKGDFDTKIELNRNDEFEQLATGFNKMTRQLKDTMAEQVAAERKINETRIAMMQAQLNPHFLYNTLDTIKWVAKANQVPEVATLSASLASILRSSISEKQFCTLDRELKLVENYCEIQKIRFDDRFDLTIDVDMKLREAIVPKLILQPIVENAIVHGMEDMDDGKLFVGACNIDERLEIIVRDNGSGISDEMIDALKSETAEALEGHLGMNNVNTIIKLYYGPSYGMSAIRLDEGGTEVKLVLPFTTEEDGND